MGRKEKNLSVIYCTPSLSQILNLCTCMCTWVLLFLFLLLQWLYCVYMLSHFNCVWLCDLMDHSPGGSSVHGILQARKMEWVAMPSSRGSSLSRDWTHVSYPPALAGGFFTTSTTGQLHNLRIHLPHFHPSLYLAAIVTGLQMKIRSCCSPIWNFSVASYLTLEIKKSVFFFPKEFELYSAEDNELCKGLIPKASLLGTYTILNLHTGPAWTGLGSALKH